MELLFIISIVTIIIIKYMSKAFNTVPKSESKVPNGKKRYTNYDSYNSTSPESLKNQNSFIDIHEDPRVKKNKSNSNLSEKNITMKDNIDAKNNVSLKNISEAKKAFIYSEIFNRKY